METLFIDICYEIRSLLKQPGFTAIATITLALGIGATDAATFTVVSLALIAVAALACYIPARRATKVDPLVTLRYE